MPDNPPLTIDPSSLPGFQTTVAQPWLGGVQLNKPLTDIAPTEAARLSNFVHAGGDLSVRPGLTLHVFNPAGEAVNRIRRLTDPQNGLTKLFFGASTRWYRASDGDMAPELLESGFSGDPLTMVPIRKPQASGTWMLVADRFKMRKAGLAATPSRPIGVAAPTVAPTVSLGTRYKTPIAAFDSSDDTQASKWTLIAGLDDTGAAGGATPTAADVTGVSGSAVKFSTKTGNATTAYRSIAALAKALDLSVFSGGPAVTDDDLIHLQLRMSDPTNITEVRLYFVCSAFSATNSIPGTSETENTSAYLHALRPSDFAAFISTQETAADAGSRAAGNALVGGTRVDRGQIRTSNDNVAERAVPRARQPHSNAPAGGAGTWVEISQIGLPVRRSDFVKIGDAGKSGTDWSTVTGIYLVIWTQTNADVAVSLDDCYLFGGAGPDSSEPGAQKYDYRYIHHDTQTGARSNGSPTMDQSAWIDSQRQAVQVRPSPAGNANMRQEVYRRGGSITDDWYFVGENSSDGGTFTDTVTDAAAAAADTLPTLNFQPVPTVDGGGNTILAQPVPILFGPIGDGVYCALGDPNRAGHVYACLPGNFDAWPGIDNYAIEVCAPSEELMNGAVLGGGGFVLSRERGYQIYPDPNGGGILSTPTSVTPGLAARWGFCVGPGGAYYVARDGVRVTNGADSQILSDALRPLFNGTSVSGRHPINFQHEADIQLALHNNDLWFTYLDTGGTRQCAVYSLLYRYWRFADFGQPLTAAVYSDETKDLQAEAGLNRLLLATTSGLIARHEGTTDLGVSITASLRTGAWTFGQARADKLFGDMVVDADLQGATAVARTYFNAETVASGNLPFGGTSGRRFVPLQPFGPEPERARSLSLDLSLVAPSGARPTLYGLGAAVAPQPEVTDERVTAWEALPGGEAYLQGVRLDCDTKGTVKSLLVEADLNGVITTIATLAVQTTQGTGPSTRHTLWFSWPAAHANLVRLRPADAVPWTLWRADWLSQAEPPRIAAWDTNWESPGGDRYYTGLDIECDTLGQPKTLQVYVDQVLIGTYTVTAAGRRYVHLTLPTGRGHLFRFVATDAHPGLLYWHEWLTTEEPREQSNWNAGYTVWSSLSDKYLKGLIIEADTFSQIKTITVEIDGVVAHTFSAIHAGRSVQNYTFPQLLGRVFRVIPTDSNPSRLYNVLPIFDEEPYALSRWETQLLDFGLPGSGWGSVQSADVCYRSQGDATLTLSYYNQVGGLLGTQSVTLPSTGSAKQKRFVPFTAHKGVLFKFVIQHGSDSPAVTLYQEESRVRVQPWGGVETHLKPFGNGDVDQTRNMVSAVAAAGRSGGGS